MDSKDTLAKSGIMAKLRNRKGFSLIEMAIVLVIIGIIIAAIIKGQDLITNSQAKKVVSAVSSWRNLTLAFLDRNGRFPGDQQKNGVIGDQLVATGTAENGAANSAVAELAPIMENVPDNPIIVGSTSFYVYMGNTTGPNGARNAILVCGDSACANVFTDNQLEIIKTIDTSLDGGADAGMGSFRAVTTAPTLDPVAPALAGAVNGRWSATFTAAGVVSVPNTVAGTSTAWASGPRAAVWLFDKNY
ncbi:MAG: prepilin-type N-terminal cleavage/methylation domain-containing protein [Geobacteraceae bacterium]|nr:prepilin-type N-terminal cleavage/methylation domain-containing protein [Geobacteraceae bacterium]NTW80796.1 prepilin-type N-terminal cleavage/methylation domain-containing protein [Geobacteraceae bacterium]